MSMSKKSKRVLGALGAVTFCFVGLEANFFAAEGTRQDYLAVYSSSQLKKESLETRIAFNDTAKKFIDDTYSWKLAAPFYIAVKRYILGSYSLPESLEKIAADERYLSNGK